MAFGDNGPFGIRQRYLDAKYEEIHRAPYTDVERADLRALQRRTQIISWAVLLVAPVVIALTLVFTGGLTRGELLIISVASFVTSGYVLIVMAVKQRRGTLPGQGQRRRFPA